MKAYKFKIKRPSKAITNKFENTLDCARELYNAGLQERRDAWKINRISITYQDQQNQLPDIRKSCTDVGQIYSQICQDVLKRLDKTFKSFFSRVKKSESKVGFPRFVRHSKLSARSGEWFYCSPERFRSFVPP